MKGYVKPSFSIIQLRVEEGIACSGSDCTQEFDGGQGRGRGQGRGGRGRGGRHGRQ